MRVRVEEARSCMAAARSQSKVLDSLMQLKRSGRLPGIHGRLVCSLRLHCVGVKMLELQPCVPVTKQFNLVPTNGW